MCTSLRLRQVYPNLAAVSHELRTPLMGILSMAELLESEVRGPLNPDQTEYVAAIVASGQRLSATINDVLHYASLVAGKRPLEAEFCQLGDLCEGVVRAHRRAADAKQQAALFRPFVQGDQTLARRFEGLGLGLASAYEMVTRLGGTITVDSAPGAGSRFTVVLPAQLPHN